jgi:hypothetical protein
MSLSVNDIEPGDVLLFHGHGLTSWAIRKLDGTRVNHAAIALAGGMLGEAAGSGLRQFDIARAVAGSDFTVVRRLPDQDLAPVLARANNYLDGSVPYAYQQIVLLALLTTTRKVPLPRFARRLLRSVLDHAAAALNEMVDSGSRTMICSEYVYRCYDEAGDAVPDVFSLDILGHGGPLSFGETAMPPGGEEASFLQWALSQPPEAVESAGSQAFGVGAAPTATVDPAQAEEQLAPLIAEYAMRVDPTDPEVLAMAPIAFGTPTEAEQPEPTDEEILTSMASFSLALEQHQAEKGEGASAEFGVGERVASGALKGLIHVTVDPNFVTPGDLLNTPTLKDIGEL